MCPAEALLVDGYRELQLHKEQLTYDVGSECVGIKTCSGAYNDAQNIAMYPSQTLLRKSG